MPETSSHHSDDLTLTASVSPIKTALRARIRGDRRARSADSRQANARDLTRLLFEMPEISTARCVAAYASMPTEPATGPLRRALRGHGVRTLLPIMEPDGSLDWAQDNGRTRRASGFGGTEPTGPRLGPAAITEVDVVIVPALAVDTLGHRLGQGAGCYDRTLPRLGPVIPVVALVYDGELFDAAVEPLPTQAHDIQVDVVVTPSRCLRLGSHRQR